VPLAGAIGAVGGFVSGFLGTAIGHWWDELPVGPEGIGSAALYTAVVSGFTSALLTGLLMERLAANPALVSRAIFGISALSAFLASLSASLLDDLRAREERGRESRY
jgi:hypothetical protein